MEFSRVKVVLFLVCVAVLIGLSDSVRFRVRYVRVRYSSGYSSSSSSSDDSLSGGVIAAIVIGSIAGPIVCVVCICCCVVCCAKAKDESPANAGKVITRSPEGISTVQDSSSANGFSNAAFSTEMGKSDSPYFTQYGNPEYSTKTGLRTNYLPPPTYSQVAASNNIHTAGKS